MAILPDRPGLVVEIVVNGEPLAEYDSDEVDTPGTITKYIAAETDQNFLIKYQCIRGVFDAQHDVRVAYSIDSGTSGNRVCRKQKLFELEGKGSIKGLWTRVGGREFISKFRFSALQIQQDGASRKDAWNKLKSLGTIKVQMFWVKLMPNNEQEAVSGRFVDTDPGIVPEKHIANCALSHHMRLDPPEPKPNRNFFSIKPADGMKSPFATFIFVYRSIESLRALGIMSTSPQPPAIQSNPMPAPTAVSHEINPGDLQTSTSRNGYRNISKAEIITLIRGYRESSAGLQLLEHNELVTLLLSYRGKATARATIKREHSVATKGEEDNEIEIGETRSKKR